MNSLTPIVIIFDENDGYFPTYPPGFWIKPSELNEVINGLIDYANAYSDDDIEKINKEKENEWFGMWSNLRKDKRRCKNKFGYVYVLTCADKYKIGWSKDVQQRMKQLDTRPFKLELLFEAYSTRAYDIEKELHKRLAPYKADGEWYNDLSMSEADFKLLVKEIAEDLKCDIQF